MNATLSPRALKFAVDLAGRGHTARGMGVVLPPLVADVPAWSLYAGLPTAFPLSPPPVVTTTKPWSPAKVAVAAGGGVLALAALAWAVFFRGGRR